jgi:hypothetical protein
MRPHCAELRLIDGQRVSHRAAASSSMCGKELPLGTYQSFQRVSPAEETVSSNLMRGLRMRDYKLVVQQFMDAYGLEKSAVSERFVEASRKKLEKVMSRSLQYLQQICAVDRSNHLQRPTPGRGHRHRCLWQESRLGPGTRGYGECQSGQWVLDQLAEHGLDFSQPSSICLMEAGLYARPSSGMPERPLFASVVNCIRHATSWPTCPTASNTG